MPSREFSEIMALIPADFADPTADHLAVRAMLKPFHGHPVPDHVTVREAELDGVRVAWYSDEASPPVDRVAFHCHGGGFVSSPLDDYHFYGAMLVEQLGLGVVLPDYRLAPEHVFPAAHDDCLSAYRGLLDSGVDPGRLVVMGDSCGGGLALSTLIAARDEGLAMPACFVSISGWFDLSVAQPNEDGPDPFLTAGWVRRRALDYTAGQVALDDPRVSPAFADLEGLPPLYLPVGEYDTLRDGVSLLAESARRSAVAVTLDTWPGVGHGWHGLVGMGIPEAIDAWRAASAFIDAAFSSS